jgi:hypothetical protein
VFTCCPKYSQFQNTIVSHFQQRLLCYLSVSPYCTICGLFTEGVSSHEAGLTDKMAGTRHKVQHGIKSCNRLIFWEFPGETTQKNTRNTSDATVCVGRVSDLEPPELHSEALLNVFHPLTLYM